MDRPDSLSTRRAVLAGVGAVAAGSGVVYAGSQLGSDANDASSLADRVQFHSRAASTDFGIDLTGHPLMGSPDAPVDMYYWSDYQCPFCRRFERNAFPKLVENHVATGTVRVVFIEFPYLSEGSTTAAVMDRCVWRQVREEAPGRYWQWHATMFEQQGEKGSGWLARDNLLDITRSVDGIDADAVDACMRTSGAEIRSSIDADVERARQLGIRGSPGFVLYDRTSDRAGKLVGAQPYSQFDEAITKVQNA
jgi:protein-disulfide isomerase